MPEPAGQARPAPHAGRQRTYVGMHEVSASDSAEDGFVSQDPLKDRPAVQAAIEDRGTNKTGLRKWIAAAVGLALLLILLLSAVLVGNAARFWQ